MKTCTKCQTPKPLEDFTRDARNKDGRKSRCLLCERLRVAVWSNTPAGKAYRKAYNATRVVDHQRHYLRYKTQIDTRMREVVKNTSAFIDSLKNAPCMDCKEVYPPLCMDWDHVRGTKTCGISRMRTSSRDRILVEVAKCDLVCACCHRIRTDRRTPKSKLPWKIRLRAKLDALKSQPCMDCGGILPPSAMDFDHVSGQKVEAIGRMFGWGWARVVDEVAKCDVVCAVCHRLRHYPSKMV